ncbi:ankyrin repeat and MYND domain-containing protein 1-like isoform X2 [Dunckerocampus dactyliophorus]|uniref:ankyrin repeat and MYND domain-containing protein 1-like isoform X2 n=1 Tax=Dunckerocampus dactyliophorus TaxID=161453 RepID=UPI002405F2EB|nr:ankyrin repeat and MYND domain-containing protein 1-like isoform X2 [Dunckerocampus dactyliophorus]
MPNNFYEGSFYKDYRHGDGVYFWPSGHKFIGKFYLNWREGYGQQLFPDGATFQGLYHADQRFGPGVLRKPSGHQDVGHWIGKHLIQLCNSVQDSFSLKNVYGYADYLGETTATHCQSQVDTDESWLLHTLSSGIESYCINGDHLPLPPGRRKEFDRHFYGKLWEPDVHAYQGYKRDPHANMPLKARMLTHIHKHRQRADSLDWDVSAVLSLVRDSFGPKGLLEVRSELLIHQASRGERQAVLKSLLDGLIHPDVADSQGHTALIAATVNCHNDVIQLLLDMGADIDRANSEGMTALSVCHVLYYPFQSLCTLTGLIPKTQISPVDSTTDYTYTESIRGKVRTRREDCNLEEGAVKMRHFYEAEGSGKDEEVLLSEVSVQVMDDHIVLGSVKWKGYPSGNVQHDCNDETAAQSFPSTCSVYSFDINVSEEVLQEAAEALSQTGFCQDSDTQDTVRKMAAMKFMHRVRLTTLNLLLDQGADPNICRVPLPVLFLAIMAADTETVKKLLLCGAQTDISLPPERKGFYPLHVAAALPGPEGPRITKLLLHKNALTNPDARACNQDDIYELDRLSLLTRQSWRSDEKPRPKEGGQTALHIACQRDTDHCNASKVVALLLSYNASTDFLWSGHSPLSLAIASGNDMAVEELLKVGADPNLPLGRGVGSALCALGNFNYHLDDNRPKLLDMLEKAGADILMPVQVGDTIGTAVDYAYQSFNQDSGIASTPYHALSMEEREVFQIRRQLLSMMGNLLRKAAAQKEREQLEMEECLRSPSFKFCYHCGRSSTVKLTACTRCHKVFYCSITCKLKAWAEKHKEECLRESGTVYNFEKRVMFQTKKRHKHSVLLTSRRPFHVQFKSKVMVIGDNISEWQSINLKENYSYN